jgi:hypothetical protein
MRFLIDGYRNGVHLVVGGDIEATGGGQGRRGITPTQRPTKIKKLM